MEKQSQKLIRETGIDNFIVIMEWLGFRPKNIKKTREKLKKYVDVSP